VPEQEETPSPAEEQPEVVEEKAEASPSEQEPVK